MKAHLEAIRTAINAACPVDLWSPEPGRIPPWMSIEAPSWAPDPDECMCGTPHQMELIVQSDDLWVRSDGVWRLKTSVQNDLTVRRDGEDLFHQGN